jgi:hypothetical protein
MLSSRGVHCLRTLSGAPIVWSSKITSNSVLNKTFVVQPERSLNTSIIALGQHGVTKEASLPPDATQDKNKVMPVPEEDRDPLQTNATPQEVYNWKVQYHDLSSDPHQQQVIDYFEALYHKLKLYRPAQPSFFATLWPSPTSNRWQNRGKSKIPRGVYLWGTVGGGKTMLMDMFF